jgi:hypothetical protein
MFRMGASEELWQPSAIDAITDRQSNATSPHPELGVATLVRRGAVITEHSAFNRSTFATAGLDYLRVYYAGTWLESRPAGFHDFWTAQRVLDQQFSDGALAVGRRDLAGRWRTIPGAPTPELLVDAVNRGGLVLLPGVHAEPVTGHSIVLTRRIEQPVHDEPRCSFVAFDNRYYPPFTLLDEQKFVESMFMPERGAIVVHNPVPQAQISS